MVEQATHLRATHLLHLPRVIHLLRLPRVIHLLRLPWVIHPQVIHQHLVHPQAIHQHLVHPADILHQAQVLLPHHKPPRTTCQHQVGKPPVHLVVGCRLSVHDVSTVLHMGPIPSRRTRGGESCALVALCEHTWGCYAVYQSFKQLTSTMQSVHGSFTGSDTPHRQIPLVMSTSMWDQEGTLPT